MDNSRPSEGKEVTKCFRRRTCLESQAIAGNSPVFETNSAFFELILSSMGHVKPCVNKPGPTGKAKYTKTPIEN